jgi:hypothetical protein
MAGRIERKGFVDKSTYGEMGRCEKAESILKMLGPGQIGRLGVYADPRNKELIQE